ncbi:MAG: serine/threonine protein kinase [Chitinophagaceae bacterium]|nr:serine/threonine protein kinase [Chitinophagaceae bacterium]
MTGKTINNYTIERSLGEGGMGNVYLARHNRIDRLVAIKVLHQNLFGNENIRNRFKNEANALIKLEHPNIVKIFDYVEQDNFACLVMEYIEGYTLDDYIAKVSGPLVTAKALHIIGKVLDAVQYAHDNNIYHRDIKPGNIMVSKDGMTVRIMDFGIAKFMDAENFKNTFANTQLGTPFYMSPEQVKGSPYTRLSDIYSLGVTLFEMVTGKCPYQAITNLFELQNKIVNESLPPTGRYYPHVSPGLQNAITRATEKKPEKRFHSCIEFKTFLLSDAAPAITPTKPRDNNAGATMDSTQPLKKNPATKTKQDIQPQQASIPLPKNINTQKLLESYVVKKKKTIGWVFLVLGLIAIVVLSLAYFDNKKTEVGISDPPPGIIDSIHNPGSFTSSTQQPDSTIAAKPLAIVADSTIITSTNSNSFDSTVKEQPDEPGLKISQNPIIKDPPFRYFDKSQVYKFLAGKVDCNGEVYDGEKQAIVFSNFPKPSELKQMKSNEVIILYFRFTGKTPGNTCNYQVICTKRESDFDLSPPITN